MMPDLGKYETVILSSYGASLLLIALLILASWIRARRVQRELSRMEEHRRRAKRPSGPRDAGAGAKEDS